MAKLQKFPGHRCSQTTESRDIDYVGPKSCFLRGVSKVKKVFRASAKSEYQAHIFFKQFSHFRAIYKL
jgi:hypothetical protein